MHAVQRSNMISQENMTDWLTAVAKYSQLCEKPMWVMASRCVLLKGCAVQSTNDRESIRRTIPFTNPIAVNSTRTDIAASTSSKTASCRCSFCTQLTSLNHRDANISNSQCPMSIVVSQVRKFYKDLKITQCFPELCYKHATYRKNINIKQS